MESEAHPTLIEQIIQYSVIGLILYLWYLYGRHKSYLYREGIPGTATVVKIFKTGISTGSDSDKPQYEITLEVNERESKTYRTTIKKTFYPAEPVPEISTEVKVKIHPKDKYKLVIV